MLKRHVAWSCDVQRALSFSREGHSGGVPPTPPTHLPGCAGTRIGRWTFRGRDRGRVSCRRLAATKPSSWLPNWHVARDFGCPSVRLERRSGASVAGRAVHRALDTTRARGVPHDAIARDGVWHTAPAPQRRTGRDARTHHHRPSRRGCGAEGNRAAGVATCVGGRHKPWGLSRVAAGRARTPEERLRNAPVRLPVASVSDRDLSGVGERGNLERWAPCDRRRGRGRSALFARAARLNGTPVRAS